MCINDRMPQLETRLCWELEYEQGQGFIAKRTWQKCVFVPTGMYENETEAKSYAENLNIFLGLKE